MFRIFALIFSVVLWANVAICTANENHLRALASSTSRDGDEIELETEFATCIQWGYFPGYLAEGKCYAEVSGRYGEVWTDGCLTADHWRTYFNSLRIRAEYPDDDDMFWEPEFEYEIYHVIGVSLASGCSNPEGADVPYKPKEDHCVVSVDDVACNECSYSDGKITLVNCSNVEGVFSYLPQTVDVADPFGYSFIGSFDVDIETEEMCNHPSVAGTIDPDPSLTMAPSFTSTNTQGPPTMEPSITSSVDVAVAVDKALWGTFTHSLQTELQFTFFPGRGSRPKAAAISGLVNQTINFFDMAFLEYPTAIINFKTALKDIVLKHISHFYQGGDAFDLTFTADIIVEDSLTVTNKQVADVIAGADWNKYVGTFVRNSRRDEDHVFQHIHSVKFRGVAQA